MNSPIGARLSAVLVISALSAFPLRTAGAQARTRPPDLPFDQIRRSTPHEIILPSFALGPVTITFEETPLRDVQRALPGGRIRVAGEGDGYRAWLCYVLRSSGQRSILWLESFEQGGEDNAIMGFTLLPLAPTARVDAKCVDLTASEVELRLPHPIQFGASRSQLDSALGPPTEEHGDTLGYFYETVLPPERRTPYRQHVFSNLAIVVRGGRVVRIDIWEFSTD